MKSQIFALYLCLFSVIIQRALVKKKRRKKKTTKEREEEKIDLEIKQYLY